MPVYKDKNGALWDVHIGGATGQTVIGVPQLDSPRVYGDYALDASTIPPEFEANINAGNMSAAEATVHSRIERWAADHKSQIMIRVQESSSRGLGVVFVVVVAILALYEAGKRR